MYHSDIRWLDVFERLKMAVGSKTDAGLAKALGISQASVAASKKKKQIPPAWVINISNEFNVSADWLIYGEAEGGAIPDPKAGKSTLGKNKQINTVGTKQNEEILVETLDNDAFKIIAAADSWNSMLGPTLLYAAENKPLVSIPTLDSNNYSDIEQGDEYYEFDMALFRASWIARFGKPNKMFLFAQKDDSMHPYIHKDDTVLIDRAHQSTTSGNMVAIAIDDDISIRKIERTPGKILFRALNPEYMDIEIDSELNQKNFHVVGKVIWWCHKEA